MRTRTAGYVLLILGILIFVVGLLGHFAGHPDELVDPSWILHAVVAVPAVLSNLPEHPSTLLGMVAVVVASAGLILMKVWQRGHTRG
jgi:hypothetical protein